MARHRYPKTEEQIEMGGSGKPRKLGTYTPPAPYLYAVKGNVSTSPATEMLTSAEIERLRRVKKQQIENA